MDRLSPEARALLDGAREVHGPPAGARAAVRARAIAAARCAPSAAVLEAEQGLVAGAGGSSAGALAWGAALGAITAAGALTVAGLLAPRPSVDASLLPAPLEARAPVFERQRIDRPSPPAEAEPRPSLEAESRTRPERRAAVATPSRPRDAERGPAAPRAPEAAASDARSALEAGARDASSGAAPSRLAEEARLLSGARAALRDGEPRAALRFTAQHAERFPEGALADERWAAEALARCALGELEAAGEARAALAARSPGAPHLARIDAACASSP